MILILHTAMIIILASVKKKQIVEQFFQYVVWYTTITFESLGAISLRNDLDSAKADRIDAGAVGSNASRAPGVLGGRR